ncbi:YgfZ/GcvT domain-containing protein [uncultured Devosia sp.]|uniref:CAF17-like 4Fe-4S cluster assembly/insertion protein YgfZ n=1 Tax=uncultured Devosia sp. TaxID=211434 RepID=UPI0035CB64C4
MTIHLRADRAVFRFSGPDAHKLLNDVVTGPIPLAEGAAAWWALLSPQGKILAEGLAGWSDEALLLDVHQSVADDFFKRMRLYRLRASVVIDDLRASHVAGWDDGFDRLGGRVIAPADGAAGWTQDDEDYARMRIAAGIAELGQDFAPDTSFAHDIGMDLLEGIDFAKGCYVGQEVVSRMKHRGTARRRPVIVRGIKADAGTPVLANGRDSGTIGRIVDGAAVGIVRLDRFGPGVAATVGDKPVTLELPDWARYGLGEASAEDA